MEVPVVTRSLEEWEAVVDGNPFLARGADPGALHVAFLADRPSRQLISRLDPERSPPDEFVISGAEVYLHLPGGVARSKLDAKYFDGALETTSTARNWRTVLRLRDAAREMAAEEAG
jgi:uncharacterized protein (DUF1697 family)